MATLALSNLPEATLAIRPTAMLLNPGMSDQIVERAYQNAVDAQTNNGPVFTQAPLLPTQVYAASDGTDYFVPQAHVGKRNNNADIPNVFIAKSLDKYTLQVGFDLVRNSAIPATAQVLLPDNFSVTLQTTSTGSIPFDNVSVVPAPSGDATVVQCLFAQVDVDVNKIVGILQQDTNAWFDVRADVKYLLEAPPAEPPAKPAPEPGPMHPILGFRPADREMFMRPVEESAAPPAPAPAAQPVHFMRSSVFNLSAVSELNLLHSGGSGSQPPPNLQTTNCSLSDGQKTDLGAYYPESVPQNRSIYAAVETAFAADPDVVWVPAANLGYIKPSPMPNQYYVLPDTFGLAFDTNQNLPAMSVFLIQNEAPASVTSSTTAPAGTGQEDPTAQFHVRVQFGIAPSLDPVRLDNLRSYLRLNQGMAYADLVVGGYDQAVFQPTHLFDQITGLTPTLIGSTSADGSEQVDASQGFSVILDCSMEFYTLLAKLLTEPDGMQDSVTFTIKTNDTPAFTTSVTVQLKLDSPAGFPLTAVLSDPIAAPAAVPVPPAAPASGTPPATPSDSATPPSAAPPASGGTAPASGGGTGDPPAPVPGAQIVVSNPTALEVTVGQVIADLLLNDSTIPYPTGAQSATPAPSSLDLTGLGTAAVLLTPSPAPADAGGGASPVPSLPWNSVAVNFGAVAIKMDPATVLDRIHQLATGASINASVHVWSYLMEHPDAIPQSLAGLIGLHVQVQRSPTSTPVDITLTADTPQQSVQIAFSFSDLLAGASTTQPTLQWRCCNLYAASTGAWGSWQSNTGSDLYVTPVGV